MISFRKNDKLLKECGFLKNDFRCLYEEYETILNEKIEEKADSIKDQEGSILEKIFDK